MRRRYNKTLRRAPNLRPTKTEPQDAAPAAPPIELPKRVRAPLRQEQAPAAQPSAGQAPAAWMPPERRRVRETRACRMQAEEHDPAARRAAIDKPDPRQNVHRRARTKRAGFGAPESNGSSRMDAATPHQDLTPRTQPQTKQDRAAGCGASRATHRPSHACLRTPSTNARRRKSMVHCMHPTSRNRRRPRNRLTHSSAGGGARSHPSLPDRGPAPEAAESRRCRSRRSR